MIAGMLRNSKSTAVYASKLQEHCCVVTNDPQGYLACSNANANRKLVLCPIMNRRDITNAILLGWRYTARPTSTRLQQLDWFYSNRNNPINHHTKPTVGHSKLHFEASATSACSNLATSAITLET